MENYTTVLFVLFFITAGCAAPCELATLLSAYEAESKMCVRVNDTRSKAENCILEVQKRYQPRFQELGEEAVRELENVR